MIRNQQAARLDEMMPPLYPAPVSSLHDTVLGYPALSEEAMGWLAYMNRKVELDGTWSKAKTLWWRNPWLAKLNRMTLKPEKPSIYGRLRAEPRTDYVSTLESVTAALTLCGEAPEIEAGLARVFRTMVQRVLDADLPPPERKLPRTTRPPRGPKLPGDGKGSGTPKAG